MGEGYQAGYYCTSRLRHHYFPLFCFSSIYHTTNIPVPALNPEDWLFNAPHTNDTRFIDIELFPHATNGLATLPNHPLLSSIKTTNPWPYATKSLAPLTHSFRNLHGRNVPRKLHHLGNNPRRLHRNTMGTNSMGTLRSHLR